METKILSAADANTAKIAADIIRCGGLVAIPTETVYGLGANGLNEQAVAKIFIAKGRPQDNPLILHVAEPEDMERFCHHIPDSAYALAKAFWPGPLTLVLPAKKIVPKCTTAGLPTVAVRCPDNDITRQIIRLAGVPVAAPSANLSGKPSTTTAEHVRHDHDGKIDAIVDGGACRVGVESTIVDLTEKRPRLLRPGGVTPEQLIEVLGDLVVDKAVTAQIDKDAVVKAPGMKYRHYAPESEVVIVAGSRQAACAYIHRHFEEGDRVLCFEEELPLYGSCAPLSYGKEADAATLSAGLFAALRELDDPSIRKVYARCPEGGGVAYAVQNRLKKAAAFHIVDAELSPAVIGITGGSGSGKTTLLEILRQRGFTGMDCDAIYHRLLETDTSLLNAIAAQFPTAFENGSLNRKKLGDIVFGNQDALHMLNRITHEAVKEEILKQLHGSENPVAIDAIGLFESGLNALCTATVAVLAPKADRIQRLTARDGISEEYAEKRIAAQHGDHWYREHCDHVLINNSTPDAFTAKCLAFYESLSIMKEKQ